MNFSDSDLDEFEALVSTGQRVVATNKLRDKLEILISTGRSLIAANKRIQVNNRSRWIAYLLQDYPGSLSDFLRPALAFELLPYTLVDWCKEAESREMPAELSTHVEKIRQIVFGILNALNHIRRARMAHGNGKLLSPSCSVRKILQDGTRLQPLVVHITVTIQHIIGFGNFNNHTFKLCGFERAVITEQLDADLAMDFHLHDMFGLGIVVYRCA